MATTYTTAQVRDYILVHLGILPPGESATAHDADLVEAVLESVQDRLDGLGLRNWPPCAVPANILWPLTKYAAADLIDAYGLGADAATRVLAQAEVGLKQIRQQVSIGWTEDDHVDVSYY